MSAAAWHGGAVSPRILCVRAENPGPMTLDGTNTWVLHNPEAPEAIVVDPGPADEDHLQRVLDVVRSRGASVALVLLTHGHDDHVGGARRFAELAGCAVRAVDPAYRVGASGEGRADALGLADGSVVSAGGLELAVVGTPGHTSDSVSFLLPDERVLLTGDTVLGRGTTVVAYPDGALGPYLASLARLRALVDDVPVTLLLPGHGPVVDDPAWSPGLLPRPSGGTPGAGTRGGGRRGANAAGCGGAGVRGRGPGPVAGRGAECPGTVGLSRRGRWRRPLRVELPGAAGGVSGRGW